MISRFASELSEFWGQLALLLPEERAGTGQHVLAGTDLHDLCTDRIILMEMESHDAAWPFLEPVNPRLVSGYRRVIKNPMDFSTMRERLLRGG
jgi:hypothetical protein